MGTISINEPLERLNGTWRGQQSPDGDAGGVACGAVRRKRCPQALLAAPLTLETSRPGNRVVLLAHALPDVLGIADSRRVYEILRSLATRWDVALAVFDPHPVHLDQWRRARVLTDRWLLRSSVGKDVAHSLSEWLDAQPVAAVVASNAHMHQIGRTILAEVRVCDQAGAPITPANRWWHRLTRSAPKPIAPVETMSDVDALLDVETSPEVLPGLIASLRGEAVRASRSAA